MRPSRAIRERLRAKKQDNGIAVMQDSLWKLWQTHREFEKTVVSGFTEVEGVLNSQADAINALMSSMPMVDNTAVVIEDNNDWLNEPVDRDGFEQ